MNWYNVFYWITVGDSISLILGVIAIISLIALIISIIGYFVSTNSLSENAIKGSLEEQSASYKEWLVWHKTWKRSFISMLITVFISSIAWSLIPTKKDSLLIIAGGGTMNFLTTDSSARQLPHEMTTFVVNELKSMAVEAKVDLGIASQKDKILDEAKKMTTDELMKKMKLDSNFAKIIMDK